MIDIEPNPLAIYMPSFVGGGAERVMITLANAISARGFPLDLVVAKAEGPYRFDISDDVRIIDLKASRVSTSLPGLTSYLRKTRPRALLSTMYHANINAIAAHSLARVPTRLVVREAIDQLSLEAPAASRLLFRALMRLCYPRVATAITVSEGVAESLAQVTNLPREKIEVIYNPVSLERVQDAADRPFNHSWFSQGEPPIVLGAGRLVAQKDFDTLVRAFSVVRRKRKARLVILGDGELRKDLEALVRDLGIADDVLLPGFQANPFAWMKRASVFALSSRYEGMPNALLEAMACGTPVVSTDCRSGPSEILENGKWGRLIPVGDIGELATAIEVTLDAPSACGTMRRAADFDVDRVVDKYISVLGLRNSL